MIRNRTSRGLTIGETGQYVDAGATAEVPEWLEERLLDQPDVWGPADAHPCPDCDFEGASKGGLTTHRKTHDEEADR